MTDIDKTWLDSTCNQSLKQHFLTYPRTCEKCGLGPCIGTTKSALNKQVAGSHYKELKIQPVEFIHQNEIGFMAGNVIKYVCRYKAKNGVQDLEKAKHYLEMLIEQETKESK